MSTNSCDRTDSAPAAGVVHVGRDSISQEPAIGKPSSAVGSNCEHEDNQETEGGLINVEGIDPLIWQKNLRAKSWVWRFFWKSANQTEKKRALCLICESTVSCSSTVNLNHHLDDHHSKHRGYMKEKEREEKRRKGEVAAKPRLGEGNAAVGGGKSGGRNQESAFMKKYVELGTKNARIEGLLQFIVKDLESFDTVESENFRRMLLMTSGKQEMSFLGARTMVGLVNMKAKKVREIVCSAVAGRSLSLTGDGWESRSQDFYYSLTAHCIDENFELKAYTLACRKLDGRHTGERIAAVNRALLKEFNIDDKNITVFTTDTAANHKKAIRLMGLPWMACTNHVLELSIGKVVNHDSVRELYVGHRCPWPFNGNAVQAIQAATALVAFTHRSSPAREELQAAQRGCALPAKHLCTYSETRWWTLADLVESVTKNERAIEVMFSELLAKDKTVTVPNLTRHQYDVLRDLLKILDLPRQVQRVLEGEKYVTISNVDVAICGLLRTLESVRADFDNILPEVRDVAVTVQEDIIKRWHPQEEILPATSTRRIGEPLRIARIAAVLDPRTKSLPQTEKSEIKQLYMAPIKEELASMAEAQAEKEMASAIQETDDHMRNPSDKGCQAGQSAPEGATGLQLLMLKAQQGRDMQEGAGFTSDEESNDEGDDRPPRKKTKTVRSRTEGHRLDYEAELKRYRKHEVSLEAVNQTGGPLAWWKKHANVYPIVAELAIKYLAVQATSASSERLFSSAGNTIAVKRARLEVDNVEDVVFLHGNHTLW